MAVPFLFLLPFSNFLLVALAVAALWRFCAQPQIRASAVMQINPRIVNHAQIASESSSPCLHRVRLVLVMLTVPLAYGCASRSGPGSHAADRRLLQSGTCVAAGSTLATSRALGTWFPGTLLRHAASENDHA